MWKLWKLILFVSIVGLNLAVTVVTATEVKEEEAEASPPEEAEENEENGASVWTWIGLILLSSLSFYMQAMVTEERFVPALNVIATALNMPDDVAGATLMAAGASSPELFSSIVALFITHSALGLGTIVGSEIFNQLVICAGSVLSSKHPDRILELDPAILWREMGFYALSIGLLYFALHDIEPVPDDDKDHIFISFVDALILFSGYILYVIICAYFESIRAYFISRQQKQKQQLRPINGNRKQASVYGSIVTDKSVRTKINLPDMPYVKQAASSTAITTETISREPKSNFSAPEGESKAITSPNQTTTVTLETTLGGETREERMLHRQLSTSSHSHLADSLRRRMQFSDGGSVRAFQFLIESERPSLQHDLYDIETNSFEERTSCFLWQRSYFYNKAKFAMNGWHLRWFTFTPSKVTSVPDRNDFSEHRIRYPLRHVTELQVDHDRRVLCMVTPKRNYYLMAPSHDILDAAVNCLNLSLSLLEKDFADDDDDEEKDKEEEEAAAVDEEAHGSLLDPPQDGGSIDIFFHFLLLPFKYMVHLTTPDVRQLDANGVPMASTSRALMGVVMCVVWLIVGSYAMVASLEALADLMNIPAAVVGVTVSAAGTSLPNYVASQVAASKGFGNMAVSNAFGSNTFNIMVGLGLPWVLYTSFGTNFAPYHGLRNEGILESVIILSLVLAVFVVIVLFSNFVLYRWHAYLFFTMYILYLAYAIGSVYI